MPSTSFSRLAFHDYKTTSRARLCDLRVRTRSWLRGIPPNVAQPENCTPRNGVRFRNGSAPTIERVSKWVSECVGKTLTQCLRWRLTAYRTGVLFHAKAPAHHRSAVSNWSRSELPRDSDILISFSNRGCTGARARYIFLPTVTGKRIIDYTLSVTCVCSAVHRTEDIRVVMSRCGLCL